MLKKFQNFFSGRGQSLLHFPLTYVMLLALTVLAIDEVGTAKIFIGDAELYARAFGLTALLGLIAPLWVLLKQEVGQKARWISLGGQLLALVLGVRYYLAFVGVEISLDSQIFFSILPFVLGVLALLFVVALAFRQDQNHTWATLWAGIINAGFGTVSGLVLRGGIAGTFASIQALFDVSIASEFYGYLGAIAMIFVNGSLFLTSAMREVQEQVLSSSAGAEFQLSRIGKIFANYIILPLEMIYLAIFLAYGVKILIVGEWPRGILVNLGMGYVAFGLVEYFLTATEKGQIFARLHQVILGSFYLIAALMAGAIWLRIEQYGVTIDRYLVCALILAVVLFTTGMLIWKEKRMLTLFGVLLVMTVGVGYGPLSAPNMAFNSQKARLETALAEHNLTLPLGSGSLHSLSVDKLKSIVQPLDYLAGTYRADRLSGKIVDQFECMKKW